MQRMQKGKEIIECKNAKKSKFQNESKQNKNAKRA